MGKIWQILQIGRAVFLSGIGELPCAGRDVKSCRAASLCFWGLPLAIALVPRWHSKHVNHGAVPGPGWTTTGRGHTNDREPMSRHETDAKRFFSGVRFDLVDPFTNRVASLGGLPTRAVPNSGTRYFARRAEPSVTRTKEISRCLTLLFDLSASIA